MVGGRAKNTASGLYPARFRCSCHPLKSPVATYLVWYDTLHRLRWEGFQFMSNKPLSLRLYLEVPCQIILQPQLGRGCEAQALKAATLSSNLRCALAVIGTCCLSFPRLDTETSPSNCRDKMRTMCVKGSWEVFSSRSFSPWSRGRGFVVEVSNRGHCLSCKWVIGARERSVSKKQQRSWCSPRISI